MAQPPMMNQPVNNGGPTPQQLAMTPIPNPMTPQINNPTLGVPGAALNQPQVATQQFHPQQMPTPQTIQGIPVQFPTAQGMTPAPALAPGMAPGGFVQGPNGMLLSAQGGMVHPLASPNRVQPQPQPQPQPQQQLQSQAANNTNKKPAAPKRKPSIKQTPKISSPQPITKAIPKIDTPSEAGLTPTPSGATFVAANSNAIPTATATTKPAGAKSPAVGVENGGLTKEELQVKNELKAKELAKIERAKMAQSKPEKYLLGSLANLLELNKDVVDLSIDLVQNEGNDEAVKNIKADYEDKHKNEIAALRNIKTPNIPANTNLISPKQSPHTVKGLNVVNDGTAVSADIAFSDVDQWHAKIYPQAIRSKLKEVPSVNDLMSPTMPTPPQDEKTVTSSAIKPGVKRTSSQIDEVSDDIDASSSKRIKAENGHKINDGEMIDSLGKNEVNDTFDFDSIFNFDGDEDVSNAGEELFGMF